jgi:threonine dehydrogenase-like Zn-dependent dehydrogenase
VTDTPKPGLKPGHVLLKVGYVGFCGSDLNTFRGLNPLVKLPIIPGHEIGAVIEAVADDVPAGLEPGMNATVNPYTSCGNCPACRNGRPNACEFNQTLGVQRNGAMSEYLLVPWEKVIADREIPVCDFALVEPVSVGFHAVSRAQATDTDTVVVIGCGMIGIGAIVRAALRGAKVIAVDVDDKKLELAKSLGARYTVNSMKENLHDRIWKITGNCGASVAIEAVGRHETYVSSIEDAAFTGRVVYIGYAKEKVAFDTSYFVKKELDIRGSRNAMPCDFKAVMEYMKRGTCPVDKLVTAVYAPEEAQVALERWSADPGKVFRILIRF